MIFESPGSFVPVLFALNHSHRLEPLLGFPYPEMPRDTANTQDCILCYPKIFEAISYIP